MVSSCHPRAPSGKTTVVSKYLSRCFGWQLAAALSVILAFINCSSALAGALKIRPFEAVSETSALGMTLDLTRTLVREDDVYLLKSSGKNFLIKMDESAEFRINESGIEGIRFDSKVRTLKTNKRSVEFDTKKGVIKSLKRGKWTEHPLTPGILDQFSQQQQLRLTLMRSSEPPSTLQFRVVDGAKISDKSWRRLPNETLKTPLGEIDTVRYQAQHKNPKKRASEIWLAPSLDYLMLKTKHVEGASTIKVDIKTLTWLD